MKQRKDFKNVQSDQIIRRINLIPNLCQKPYPHLLSTTYLSRSYECSQKDKLEIISWLKLCEIFKPLPKQVLLQLAQAISSRFYKHKEFSKSLGFMRLISVVCKQGDKGDCAYIIFSGVVDVIYNGKMVAKYNKTECVGRMALEKHGVRTASLAANGTTQLLILHKWDYDDCISVGNIRCAPDSD